MVRKDAWYDISFKIYQGLLGGPQGDQSWGMFHVDLRRTCILLLLDGMLYKYQLNIISSNVSFNAYVSLLIFCVNDLCIGVNGVLKSKY